MARKKTRNYPNRDGWKCDGQLFYRLKSTGHDPDRERPGDRCFGYFRLDRNRWDFGDFSDSMPIENWGWGELVLEPNMPLDDMPWNTGDALLVSTRLKKLIETFAPRQAQFLPISIVEAKWNHDDDGNFTMDEAGSRAIGNLGDYWVMNTLVEVDCMDWARAKAHIWGVTIQAEKVPEDVLLFRIKGQPASAYCRRRLRELCDDAGLRGPQFGVAPHVWHDGA